MLSVAATTRIFVALDATDMRKGFDGLYAIVENTLRQDPLSGALFLFVNRRRDRLKVLYWDGDGLAIWYRRLEQGTFQFPQSTSGDATSVEIRSDEFTMLLRGIDLNSVKRRKRYSIAS
jgi:transposase